MKKQIKRLRLKDGDIVVVKDIHTFEALLKCKPDLPANWHIPIIYAPQGIKRFSANYLDRLRNKTT